MKRHIPRRLRFYQGFVEIFGDGIRALARCVQVILESFVEAGPAVELHQLRNHLPYSCSRKDKELTHMAK